MHKKGFPPVVPASPRVLILGSMPGEQSLAATQYYAHPHNLFWPFMANICGETLPGPYDARLEMLHRHGIALWDVCDTCIREGSLDTAIREVVPNALPDLLREHPSIQLLAFNGQKAAALFHRYFGTVIDIAQITLPSTSPANAGKSRQLKEDAWLELKNWLNDERAGKQGRLKK
ncbi:MAG: DNA-deoxyinosine glycosylase [Rubrivivax sp.]